MADEPRIEEILVAPPDTLSPLSSAKALPPELYSKIFEDLDYQSLLTCAQVCVLFKKLIEGTASLQYVIELSVAGQLDGKSRSTSATRLEILRKHQLSWNNLEWSREIKIPMHGGGLWELFGGVLAQSTADDTIVFHQLPSDLRSIPEKQWTLSDLSMSVRDFAMDPSQNLLVLIESPDWTLSDESLAYRIHLRKLSDGKPHQLAPKPILLLRQEVRDHMVSYTIQVFGSILGILFSPASVGENELAIWEWTTGSLLMDTFDDDILSFTFLSDAWVLICNPMPALTALNFRKGTSERRNVYDLTNYCHFEFPEMDEVGFITGIDIRADPGPMSPTEDTAIPFSQDPADFIIILTFWLFMTGNRRSLIHVIPSKHLLSLVNAEEDLYVWTDWIPKKTRLLYTKQTPSDIWVCYVYGAKFIMSERLPRGQSGYSARLFNFNQLALRRERGQDSETRETPKGLKTSAALRDVDASLPFSSHSFVLEDAHDHCSVLCSEDHILIVDSSCREYRVLVF